MTSAAQTPRVRLGVLSTEAEAEAPYELWVCPTHRPTA